MGLTIKLPGAVCHDKARANILDSPGRLTGASRIETVFGAHFGDERKILAACDR
jgi:hypothetical protein